MACGSRELAAALVALNSVFQIVMYSVLGWFYLAVLPGWLGLDTANLHVSLWDIARSVLIFLGVPLAAGFLTRTIGEARKGADWYEHRFLPRIAPVALWGLLFTIVVLFALQGKQLTTHPIDVLRVAVPLLLYFALMWGGSFYAGYRIGLPYDRNASVAFTAAGNNFELAIAVSIAVFGITSGQALAGTIGPLIEVPALITLCTCRSGRAAATTRRPTTGAPYELLRLLSRRRVPTRSRADQQVRRGRTTGPTHLLPYLRRRLGRATQPVRPPPLTNAGCGHWAVQVGTFGPPARNRPVVHLRRRKET